MDLLTILFLAELALLCAAMIPKSSYEFSDDPEDEELIWWRSIK